MRQRAGVLHVAPPMTEKQIVGTAANCERLVAEISADRKVKPQKTKTKTSEGRKQLNSVRVIRRNLVYIGGLPLNLADEELLQRTEYFSQYDILPTQKRRKLLAVFSLYMGSSWMVDQ